MADGPRIAEAGWMARAALCSTGGRTLVLAALSRAVYLAPLHDLTRAPVVGDRPGAALDAARRLVRIGHSGWDMRAGFVAGLPDV
jgi:hypothetical protein